MAKEFVNSLLARPRRGGELLFLAIFLIPLLACSPSAPVTPEPGPGSKAGQGEASRNSVPAPVFDAWPSSRADLLNTGQSRSLTDAREGKKLWQWRAATQLTQTPVSADGVVYVGDWSPSFHAISLETGTLIWRSRPRFVKNDNRELAEEGADLVEVAAPKEFDDRYNHSAPAIFEDLVLACTQYGVLSAFRRSDGEVVWERDLEADIYSSLRVARGRVLVGDAKGAFRAFDARTGEPRFTYQTADMIGSTCAILSDGVAIFPAHDRRLHMIDIETGKPRRVLDMTYRSTSTPLVAFGCIYLLNSASRIVAIDLVDGKERWIQGATEVTSHGLARVGNLVVAHISRQLRAWDAVTGLPVWQIPLKGAGAIAPAVGPELVYVVDDAGWAHAIDPEKGEHVWKLRFAERAAAAPILVGGLLICADEKGKLLAYE